MAKEFHIGDVLSITTSKIVSLRHMEGIYDILNYMTGDNLFTHQLPRAAEECKLYLLEQFPFLKDITGDDITAENWKDWLNDKIQKFGETLMVEPLPEGVHEFKNPILEAIEMMNSNT
jgi:hypothetical protein